MKKLIITTLGLLFVSQAGAETITCAGSAKCLPNNLEVHIFGKDMGVNADDYNTVRGAIGSLVSDLQIKKFVLLARGIEGGFAACLEPDGQSGYSAMMQEMTSIQVNSDTAYTLKPVEKCSE